MVNVIFWCLSLTITDQEGLYGATVQLSYREKSIIIPSFKTGCDLDKRFDFFLPSIGGKTHFLSFISIVIAT